MATPRINSAKVFGARPGRPLQYRIAASGARPITFHAEPLPAGVSLDSSRGVLTGQVAEPGDYAINLERRTRTAGRSKSCGCGWGERFA